MEVKQRSVETLASEISQGRWLVIADSLDVSEQPRMVSRMGWLDFLVSVAENKRNIACWTALGTTLAFLFSWLIPNYYTARAELLPPQLNQSGISALLGQFGDLANYVGRDNLRTPNALFVTLLRSDSVTEQIAIHFDLMKVYGTARLSDCLRRLEKQTQVDLLKEGPIVIQVEDRDPRRAAALANAYVEELIQLNKRLAVGEAARRRIFFEQQVKEAHEELTIAEENLKQTQEQTGMVQLDSQAKSIIEVEGTLRARIALKKAQLENMRLYATEQNPDLQRLKTELTIMQNELYQAESSGKENAGLNFSSGKLPTSGLEYIRRLRDVKYHEMVFETLSKQLELARIDEAKEGSLIQVIDQARVPDHKSGPARLWITLAGLAVSLAFSFCWLAGKLSLARAQLNPDMARQLTSLKDTVLSFGKNRNSKY